MDGCVGQNFYLDGSECPSVLGTGQFIHIYSVSPSSAGLNGGPDKRKSNP